MELQARERLTWQVEVEVQKFLNDEALRRGEAYEVVRRKGNLLLNEGIAELLDLLIAAGTPTAYNNGNARIGVGNSNTAAQATDTGLLGGSTAFRAMEATYPSRSAQTVTWRALFGSGDGNFAWEEWSIDNGVTANKNLNRKVEALGTKAAGTSWQMTVTVTIS